MMLPTMSALGRAMACGGSFTLPQVDEQTRDKTRGRGRHGYIARAINFGREFALKEGSEKQQRELQAMDLDRLLKFFDGCAPVRSEVAYAYDPEKDSARELGQDLERGYERAGADRSREICGTLDLEALVLVHADEARIVDAKGRAAGDPWQLRAQALAVTRTHHLSRARVIFAHAMDDGGWRWSEDAVLGPLELDAFAAEIAAALPGWRRAAERADAGRIPDVVEGEHCDWCSAMRCCPAKHGHLVAALSGEVLVSVDQLRDFSMEKRRDIYLRAKEYLPILTTIVEESRALAALEPLDLGDGRVLQACPGNDKLNAEIAGRVLAENYGWEKLDAATTREITKAGIERALGKAEAQRAIGLIRAAGGIAEGRSIVKDVQLVKQLRSRKRGDA